MTPIWLTKQETKFLFTLLTKQLEDSESLTDEELENARTIYQYVRAKLIATTLDSK